MSLLNNFNKINFIPFLFVVVFLVIFCDTKVFSIGVLIDKAIHLNTSMFNEIVLSSDSWVIGFYKESYGYSKQMIYELEQLSMKHQGCIAVGIVNCEIDRDLCDDNAIYKYPTIKIIKDKNKTYVYDGAIKDIGKILLKKSEAPTNEHDTTKFEITHPTTSSSSNFNCPHYFKTLSLFFLFAVLNKKIHSIYIGLSLLDFKQIE